MKTSPSSWRKLITLVWFINVFFQAQAQLSSREPKFEMKASVTYDQQALNWSIGGQANAGNEVNVLSELKWKRVRATGLDFEGKGKVWKGLFFRTDFSRAFIISGNVTDTDFGKDNRKDTVFHDSFNSNKGSSASFDFCIGYQFRLYKKHLASLDVGYTSSSQLLYLLRDFGNVQGDMRSTYKTKWNGLIVGCGLNLMITKKISLLEQLSYRQLTYGAAANWNLVEEFEHPVSFRHRAKGYSIANSLSLFYKVRTHVSLFIAFEYSLWRTGKGTDTLYRTNGEISITRLNGVNRTSIGMSTGVYCSF
jgi:hypothetical protein